MDSNTVIISLFFIFFSLMVTGIVPMIANKKNKKKVLAYKTKLINEGFIITKEISKDNRYNLLLDMNNKKWSYYNSKENTFKVYNFDDLIDFEIIDNGDNLLQSKSGSALLGGVLLGGIGAIMGASGERRTRKTCNNLSIAIYTNDLEQSYISIPILKQEVPRNSIIYKNAFSKALEYYSILSIIKNKNINVSIENKVNNSQNNNKYSEIEKLHELMVKGIISQEEFSQKKKKLLDV